MDAEILLIDDDAAFLKIVTKVLRAQGFAVSSMSSGRLGIAHALEKKPGLILLDLVMPGLRGLEVCQELKQRMETADIPILILTGNDQEGQDIACLDMGADDYLTKPVKSARLLAHCRALLRRSPEGRKASVFKIGDLQFDYARKVVRIKDTEYPHLTPKEFDLLYDLAIHSPQPRDRTVLYKEIWGIDPPSEGSLKTVEVHVRRIRLKLHLKSDRCLLTIPGRGYYLDPAIRS